MRVEGPDQASAIARKSVAGPVAKPPILIPPLPHPQPFKPAPSPLGKN
jgi:hypothetical protein